MKAKCYIIKDGDFYKVMVSRATNDVPVLVTKDKSQAELMKKYCLNEEIVQ